MSIARKLWAVAVVTATCSFATSTWAADAERGGRYSNWPAHNGMDNEANYSSLEQINLKNVGELGLAWSLDLAGEVSLEATPLAVDGVLYFTGSASGVYAVDAASGKLLWRYDPEIWKHRPEHLKLVWGINRGVAYSGGRVFVGTLDGRLIALDAQSGRVIWSVKTVADDSMQTITGAPRTIKGKVLIGNGGADFGARGYVTAYDEKTGALAWRFYTVPGDPAKGFESEALAMAAKTWSGEWWKRGGGGGTVWDNMTYDPEFNQIYIGVGNAGPFNPRIRSPGGGDNLFVSSIVAVNADSGKYVWHYQVNPGDSWDYKATANMITGELAINGKSRKVLMQSPTNGFFYVIDRINGKLISAEKIGKVTWADRIDLKSGRPVENKDARYANGPVEIYPGPIGAHNWQGMSFNPLSRLVYIPYMQLGSRFADDRVPQPDSDDPPVHFGGVYIDLIKRDPLDNTGKLLAWDPVTQKKRWEVGRGTMWNGGVMSTAGGLVFQGTASGDFDAYDANVGQRVWHFNARHGIISCPITYSVGGRQYVSVLSGYGGGVPLGGNIFNEGWKFGAPRRLMTFVLGGTAVLPETAPPDFKVHAVDDKKLVIDATQAKAGLKVYQENCAYCHGRLLQSVGTPAPDLRESMLALDWQSFHTVLTEGTLLPKLMPKFDSLSEEQMRQLYMYIRASARALAGPSGSEQPSPATPN